MAAIMPIDRPRGTWPFMLTHFLIGHWKPAPTAAAFRRLRARTYRRSLEFGPRQWPRQFGILAAMAKGVPFAHVKRPAQPFLLDTLADGVERWLSDLEDVSDPPAGSPALA